MSDEEKYVLSFDGERYNDSFETREDAIAEAMATFDDDRIFYTAEKDDPLNKISFNVGNDLVELLGCWMCDNFNSDVSEDWLTRSEGDSVMKRIDKEIGPMLRKIIEEEAKPTFWGVKNVQEHSHKNECGK